MHILFICTDNGLGHLYRSLIAGSVLNSNGIDISLVAPISSAQKFSYHKQFSIYNFSITPSKFYNDYHLLELKLLELIGAIPKVDLVVFDNLPFLSVALQYPSILYANFYWHCVLDCYKNTIGADQFNSCLSAIKYHASTSLFCMNHVEKTSQPFKTYPFDKNTSLADTKKVTSNGSILISTGLSNRFSIDLEMISHFCHLNNTLSIFLEPQLFRSFAGREPPNCQIAGYSPEFYSLYDFAIVRPGLGTVLELIKYNIFSVSIYEPGNKEMVHNASVLSKLSHNNKNYRDFCSLIFNSKIECELDSNFSQLKAYNELSDTVKSYPNILEHLINEF